MSASLDLTDIAKSAQAESDQRALLLERIARRMEHVVQAQPGVSSADLIAQTAAEVGAMPRDAATALWNLVDEGKLEYLVDSRIRVRSVP